MIKRLTSSLLILFLLLSFQLILPPSAAAQTSRWTGVCVSDGAATIQGLECLIANVFTVIITLIGFAGFVMFIVGSFKWMLSGSDSKGVDSARGMMTNAVIGLVIALSAFMIINLIADFTGVGIITEFTIPRSNDTFPAP